MQAFIDSGCKHDEHPALNMCSYSWMDWQLHELMAVYQTLGDGVKNTGRRESAEAIDMKYVLLHY